MLRINHFWQILLIVSATWCLPFLCLPSEALKPRSMPNIVFILTDDQRYEDIEHMPILQRELVGRGMLFEHFFSNVSLCCPSRASILRGQYAHHTGVLTNKPPNGGFQIMHSLGDENSTIGVWLQERGYRTALIGKYLNGYPGQLGATYVPPGWDYWASASSGNPYKEYDYTLNENGKLVQYGDSPQDYGTDVYTRKAVEFIHNCSKEHKSFFVYLAFYAPHAPATPAPRHIGLFQDAKIPATPALNQADVSKMPQYIQKLQPMTEEEIAAANAYYGKRLRSLQAVDEAIKTLCKTLKDTKELDHTYIVFAADNGYHLGEHRLRRGKQTAYDTDIHLPLIVRGPGIAAGARTTELVGNIDLAPTFADLAGAQTPDFIDGLSFVSILHGHGEIQKNSQKNSHWREGFLVEHWQQQEGRKKPVIGFDNLNELHPPYYNDARCRNLSACAIQCAHRADCYCCSNNAGAGLENHCSSYPNPRFAVVSYSDQEKDELAQAGKRRRSLGVREFGLIPEYKAIRAPEGTYVEYLTGEREFYRLTEDPSQVDNLAGNTDVQDAEEKFSRAIRALGEVSSY